MFRLSKRSLNNLEGVHPALVKIVKRAIEITSQDFVVIDGVRTIEEQKKYMAKGASRTMASLHLLQKSGHSHAVDLMACGVEKEWDAKYYPAIAKAMKTAAKEFGIPLQWGGDWLKFKDNVHFQIPREYGEVFK
jgi:peptidoglycan L-alanyl-D-glutamate endopeptidase CwlK